MDESLLKLYQGRVLGDGHGSNGTAGSGPMQPTNRVAFERSRPALLDVRYEFHEGDSRRPVSLKKGKAYDHL